MICCFKMELLHMHIRTLQDKEAISTRPKHTQKVVPASKTPTQIFEGTPNLCENLHRFSPFSGTFKRLGFLESSEVIVETRK